MMQKKSRKKIVSTFNSLIKTSTIFLIANSTCCFVFVYKNNEEDASPISVKSKEVPISLGLIPFDEYPITM